MGCRGWAPCQTLGQTDSFLLHEAQVAGGLGGGSATAIAPDPLLGLKSGLCPPAHSCCWLGSWAPGSGGLSLPAELPAELVLAVSLGEPGTHFCNRIFIPHQGFVPWAVETLGTRAAGLGCSSYSHSVSLALPVSLLLSPSLPLSFEGLLFFLSHSLSASHGSKWDMKPTNELSIDSNSQLHLLSISSAPGPWSGLPAANTPPLPVAAADW